MAGVPHSLSIWSMETLIWTASGSAKGGGGRRGGLGVERGAARPYMHSGIRVSHKQDSGHNPPVALCRYARAKQTITLRSTPLDSLHSWYLSMRVGGGGSWVQWGHGKLHGPGCDGPVIGV